MADQFPSRSASQTGPARRFVAVTPNDDNDLPDGPARSLYVGGAGTLSVVDTVGNRVDIVSGPSQYHPLTVRQIRAAGTDATNIVALY